MAARKRHDPPSTSADGWKPLDRVNGKDPARHYIFANPNDEDCGVPSYEADGYEIERQRPDGPKLPGCRSKPGEPISRKGQWLMSAPMEIYAAKYDGVQAEADAFDAVAVKTGHIEDPMRGMGVGTRIINHQSIETERHPAA